jgi:hypothetical protein
MFTHSFFLTNVATGLTLFADFQSLYFHRQTQTHRRDLCPELAIRIHYRFANIRQQDESLSIIATQTVATIIEHVECATAIGKISSLLVYCQGQGIAPQRVNDGPYGLSGVANCVHSHIEIVRAHRCTPMRLSDKAVNIFGLDWNCS